MKKMMIAILVCGFMSGGAVAQDAKTAMSAKTNKKALTQVTPEQRGKMASMHEKMAGCLRSDKPLSNCHSEMQSSCREMMGSEGCSMGGQMGGMMQHEGMMGGDSSASTGSGNETHHPSASGK